MDFQVVVLAGGVSKKLLPLVSHELPNALLPVANRPVLSYVVELLELSNLKDLIVVVEGKDTALNVGAWISGAYADRLHVEVAAVPEDVGTAGAIRAIARHLYAKDILIVSGDLVSDVPIGAVAATHRRHDAVVTALLCNTPVSGPLESVSSGGKDKAKKPGRYDLIGLDPTKQFLLHIATGAEVEKDLRIQKSILRSVGQGGIAPGGFNFDAKLRRESTDVEDLFIAHIVGMDTMARGLRNAAKLVEDGSLAELVRKRYQSFDTEIGAQIEAGKADFDFLEKKVKEWGEPKVASAKQELAEMIFQNAM